MSKIFFTSDSHFGHRNVIEYCQRPFKDVKEMNTELVRRWNSVVSDEDTVYHLGDLALAPHRFWMETVQQLKGHKILILGNHDRHTKKTYSTAGFEKIYQHWVDKDLKVFMAHIPQFNFMEGCNQLWHFCGHVHTRWTRKGNIINVGVDKWDFTPRTFEELIQAKEDYPGPELPVRGAGGYYSEEVSNAKE